MINELFDRFLNKWGENKGPLVEVMTANKAYNEALRVKYNLTTKDPFYKENKKGVKVSENPVASIFLRELPYEIVTRSSLLQDKYKVEGSVGKGNISEIPWICLFDREITESAEVGYYIVYLVRADMSGFYLSLNQGWTQYRKAYGGNAKTRISDSANRLKKLLKGVGGFNFEPIQLVGDSDLAVGYELGNICSKYYSHNSVPSAEVLIDDLRNLVGVYRELKALVGKDILDVKYVVTEEEYQNSVNHGKQKVLEPGGIGKKDKRISAASSSWIRDPDIAFTALHEAGFKCENDQNHQTFISAKTGHQFVEAHHLIPMEFQDDFNVSIDVPENIVSLCPNCHRAFHNSITETKTVLIRKFFHLRKELLSSRAIEITEDRIEKYYKATSSNGETLSYRLALY
ncbi:MrcB family domain-containing protein [Pontibacter pamirensis]|uniref:MrcB family domain-containing protein n=1 Tax=Pontibacter pamirensis TaxID=2562824 RepID=UPI00138A1E9D|nr:DUF3578 domain-containing protein [Pontibacter pamirensis]